MKTIVTLSKKSWQYLFWLGPTLVVMGLSAGVVSGTWKPVPLGLVIAGIVTTGLWLLFQARASNWWSRRSTQTSANALVATLSVLIILGLVNFLANRYPVRVDLTEAQLFTLAPESRQLVRNLQEPVKVWIFDREQNNQDRELLENYRRQGSQFSYEFVDPQARPELAEKFGLKEPKAVYLEAKGQRRLLQAVDNQQRLSEVKLTNGLEQVERNRIAKAYFLQGHGERPLSAPQGGLSQALSALKDKNYTSEPLNLTQQSIPQDATVVVLAGPKRGLFDREVRVLSDYLNRGGSLLLAIDPNTNPNLDNLLKDWGVKLTNSVAIDVSGVSSGFGPAVPIVTSYGNHPITKDFGNGISFYRLARPLELTSVTGVQATPLLLTKAYPQSWAKGNLKSEDLKFDPKSDRQGPLILGAALSRKVESRTESKQSKANSPIPSLSPTPGPNQSKQPGTQPGTKPSSNPIPIPTPSPTKSESNQPGIKPSSNPIPIPTPSPTKSKQSDAKASPSSSPSLSPSPSPTKSESKQSDAKASPSSSPSLSSSPSPSPTKSESKQPDVKASPSSSPSSSSSPSPSPTPSPTKSESKQPDTKYGPNLAASPTPSPTNSPAQSASDKRSDESRLVVIGNSDFATDNLFDKQLNGDVFLNSVNWLNQQDDRPLSIRPKEVKNRRINMTPQQATILTWSSILLLPLLGFGTGAALWWKRR